MTTGSRSSRKEPDPESRPLYAGHHLHSIRNPLASCSRRWDTPPILMSRLVHDTSTWVRLYSSLEIAPDCVSRNRFAQRSPPVLLTPAAWAGLKPASDRRLRWAYHHLFPSFQLGRERLPVAHAVPLRHTVPAPDLIGRCGHEGLRALMAGRAVLAPRLELVVLPQHAVEA